MDTNDMYAKVKTALQNLDVNEDKESCRQTAEQLKTMGYAPPFLIDIHDFVNLDKAGALKALDAIKNFSDEQIASMPVAEGKSPQEIKSITMNNFLDEFVLLQRLRNNDPEGWDEINELYEDD